MRNSRRLGAVVPSLEDFREQANTRTVIPVVRRLIADAETPVGLYRKLAAGRTGTFLLESAEFGGTWARYSFIGVQSEAVVSATGGVLRWKGNVPQGITPGLPPAEALAELVAQFGNATAPDSSLPSLSSGLVGYLGWDAIRYWENLPNPPEDDVHIPELLLLLVRDLVVLDHANGSVLLISTVYQNPAVGENISATKRETELAALYQQAVERIEAMTAAIAQPTESTVSYVQDEVDFAPRYRRERQEYLDAIAAGKDAITEGEVFQVVISQRFELDTTASALDVYRVLRASNPSPYMYIFSLETDEGEPFAIVGSSPEALVKVQDGRVITHPIAGSRPRGTTDGEDQALAKELLADQKERSEHLMLVDLARNDLLKVCEPSSVDVTHFMEIERFSHIMHIVSTVEGVLSKGKTCYDVLKAAFPAGTLSGAPKPRALQLLDEFEPHRRGVYGGVIGYIDFQGNMDMAIAIRTALLKDGTAYVQAGGGIVADSVPELEFQESENKAAAPLRAVARANTLTAISPDAVRLAPEQPRSNPEA